MHPIKPSATIPAPYSEIKKIAVRIPMARIADFSNAAQILKVHQEMAKIERHALRQLESMANELGCKAIGSPELEWSTGYDTPTLFASVSMAK